MVVAAMAVAMAAAARVATATVWLAEGSWVAASATACAAAHIPPACWLWLGLGRVGVRDRVGRMCWKERCVVARGGLRHAQACGYKVHAGAGVGDVGVTRVWGGPADSMSAFCLFEGRRGGSRRKGAGEGPRPRPATKAVKAYLLPPRRPLTCLDARRHILLGWQIVQQPVHVLVGRVVSGGGVGGHPGGSTLCGSGWRHWRRAHVQYQCLDANATCSPGTLWTSLQEEETRRTRRQGDDEAAPW